MTCTVTLYPDNSIAIEATITNPAQDPIYVNDATVTVNIYDSLDVLVTGQSWPVTLVYEPASNGTYKAVIAPVSGIVAGETYRVVIQSDGADALKGNWTKYVKSETRGCE